MPQSARLSAGEGVQTLFGQCPNRGAANRNGASLSGYYRVWERVYCNCAIGGLLKFPKFKPMSQIQTSEHAVMPTLKEVPFKLWIFFFSENRNCGFRDKIATKVRMFIMAGLLCII